MPSSASVSYLVYAEASNKLPPQHPNRVLPPTQQRRPPRHASSAQPVRRKSSGNKTKKNAGARDGGARDETISSPTATDASTVASSSVYLEEGSKTSSISDTSVYTSISKRDQDLYTSFRRRASIYSQQQINLSPQKSPSKLQRIPSREKNNQQRIPSVQSNRLPSVRRVKSMQPTSSTSKSKIMLQDLMKDAGLLSESGGVDVTAPPRKILSLSYSSSDGTNVSTSPSSVHEIDSAATEISRKQSTSPTNSQKSAIWKLMVEPKVSAILDDTLQHVMDEVLLMDDEDEIIECTCPKECFYHDSDSSSSNNNHDSSSTFDYNEAATPAVTNFRKSIGSNGAERMESVKSGKIEASTAPQRRSSYVSSDSSHKGSYKTANNAKQDITFLPETPLPNEQEYSKFSPPPPPSSDDSQPSRSWGRLPDSDIDDSDHGYVIPHTTSRDSTPPKNRADAALPAPKLSMTYKQLQQQLLRKRSRHPSFTAAARASSILSQSTLVSEMTHDEIRMDILPPLKLNPKAPQYQMALEQEKGREGGGGVASSNSVLSSVSTTQPPQRRMSPVAAPVDLIKPPARRSTPPVAAVPKRKVSPVTSASSTSSPAASLPKRHSSPKKTAKPKIAAASIPPRHESPKKAALASIKASQAKVKILRKKSSKNASQNAAANIPTRQASPQKAAKPKVTLKKKKAPLEKSDSDSSSKSSFSDSLAASVPAKHASPQKKANRKVQPVEVASLPMEDDALNVTDHSPSTASDIVSAPVKTPPPTEQVKTVSELVSPGILTSVDVVASDEDEEGANRLSKPGRVSTLTYPSFGSPQKSKKAAEKKKRSDKTSEKISPETLPSVEDDEMEGSDDEDIGDAPRHLECTPSMESSDITSSYGTSTSSSKSLLPYHPVGEGGDSMPPMPPKKRGDSTGSDGNGKAALEEHELQEQEHQQALEESMTGPFISPRRDTKKRTVLPSTPQQDSNPLLFPMTLTSKGSMGIASTIEEDVNEQSISVLDVSMDESAGPFVASPTNVHRSYQARTPQQESNPLLFPQGLNLYPDVPFSDDNEFDESPQSKSASIDNSTVRRTNVASPDKSVLQPPPPPKHQRDIEFVYTPSPTHEKASIPDIDLSNHDLDFDSDLHDAIDLSHVTPEQILRKSASADDIILDSEPRNTLERTKSASDRGSRAGGHPSKKDSPHSIPSQPFAPPRRSVSFPQSVVESIARPASSSSGTTSSDTRGSSTRSSSDETTTTGGLPSVMSSPTTPKSHSSRFTVTGVDPAQTFSLVVDRDQQEEPSVFTGEDESEYDEDHDEVEEDDADIVIEETVEYLDESESEYSEEYSEMSAIMEEEEYEDSSVDDVTALDDQSEQYESLKDPEDDSEYEDLNDAQERRQEYFASRKESAVQSMPSLVSNTSTMMSNTSSEPSSLTTSSSVTVCRVRMCPMEISFVLEGEETCYTGFYSGPVNGRAEANGNGCFWFNTGDVYLGQFANGALHGCGMLSIVLPYEYDEETGEVVEWSKEILKGYFRWNEYVGTEPTESIRR